MQKDRDITCFSYIAAAQVFQIERYPRENQGAEVDHIIPTLAADAPIVSLIAARLGLQTQLIANAIGTDAEAARIYSYLKQENIDTSVHKKKNVQTPQIVILSDNSGNREWFSYTRKAQAELSGVKLHAFKRSRMLYVDLYQGIAEASIRVIDFATKNEIPSYVNVSGNIADASLLHHIKDKYIFAVQASIPENRSTEAKDIIQTLYSTTKQGIALVSMGEKGAIAYNGEEFITADAYSVTPLHVHGAGAAFSAGYIFGTMQQWPPQKSLRYACAVGSWSCTQERGFTTITRNIIDDFEKKQT